MGSTVTTMMHSVRGFFRFAHIAGLIASDPAVYARLSKVHRDEARTQGLDRLELIRFLQVTQTITVHHGALAYLLGVNAGLRRECPWPTSAPPGGQGQQARHHAPDRARVAGPGSLPQPARRWAADPALHFWSAD
jgi:hypothetical protein